VAEIRYAIANDGTHIAYREIGEAGRADVVVVAGALFPLELLVEDRVASRFIAGLASLGRAIIFDKRGIGLSDPMTDWNRCVHEQWAEDLVAVVGAAGLQRPVVVSWDANGVARRAAATCPDLFSAMVLVNPARATKVFRELLMKTAGQTLPTRTSEELAFPSRIHDEDFTDWLARSGRAGASPSSAARIWEHVLRFEGSLTPPGITTPTLVLHNRDSIDPIEDVRAVVDSIPDARLVQLPGGDVFPISGDVDPLIREIAEFVTGAPSALTPLRHLSAVLFTDLVDSTKRAVETGDAQWRELLDIHDRMVKDCVRALGGRVVKYTGDGVLALMSSATDALDAALMIQERLAAQDLAIRAGVHVGDVDTRGTDVSGVSINIAARIMGRAHSGEILVSEAARLATLGSGHRFEAAETTTLKGIPEEWALFRRVS
jgi:class 3 adenylate cyclase/pimeloyl-ACP methyl ester carboxylesterase